MEFSRRKFLGAAGASVVAVAFDVGGTLSPAIAAPPAAAPVLPEVAGVPLLASPGTTLTGTVVLGPDMGLGYRRLVGGLSEPYLQRSRLGGFRLGEVATNVPIAAFAQMTDLHVVDDQSPLRVEFTDRQADPPNTGGFRTASAYRPHEFLSTHIVDSMASAIRNIGTGPGTGLPLAFTVVTGDAVDNVQWNETRWYIDLLDGGRTIRADSGWIGKEESVSYFFGPPIDENDVGPNHHENFYWFPELHEYFPGVVDRYQRLYGYPSVGGLLVAARRPYISTGLGMPWYAVMGNHDGEIQGNYPLDPAFIDGVLLDNITGRATATFKPMGSTSPLPPNPGRGEVKAFVRSLYGTNVTSDRDRRVLDRAAFVEEHFNTTGAPAGHGFSRPDRTYYTIPSGPDDPVLYISLDTVNYDGESGGRLNIGQLGWLEGQLKANSSSYIGTDNVVVEQPQTRDKLIVIFCHHTLATIDNTIGDLGAMIGFPSDVYGAGLEKVLLRYPNVVLMVNGHTHANVIVPHQRGVLTPLGNRVPGSGGFWEVSTAAHIDWPVQSRIVELATGADQTISIFTSMVDIDAPLSYGGDLSSARPLAALARELAANDSQERDQITRQLTDPTSDGTDTRRGRLLDRNTQLLVDAPFVLPPALRGLATTPISVVARSAERMDVFAVASDRRTMVNSWRAGSGWVGWTHVGGGHVSVGDPGTAFTAVRRGETVNTFVVGEDLHPWFSGADGPDFWSPWTMVPGSDQAVGGMTCAAGSSIAAVARDRIYLDLFGVDARGMVKWTSWDATVGWAGRWTDLPGTTVSPGCPVTAVARSSTHIDLFTVNRMGEVVSTFWDASSGWYMWFVVPGSPSCRVGSTVAVVTRDNNHIDLFTTASDGRVMSTWWNADQGWPGSWFNVSGGRVAAGSAVSAISRSGTSMDLFTYNTSNQMVTAAWEASSGWTGWSALFASGSPGSHVTAVSRASDTIDLFTVRTPRSAVETARWTSASGWSDWSAVADTPRLDRLLFYRKGDGQAMTGAVIDDGQLIARQVVGGFTKGWTHVTPAGGGKLLFYRAEDGLAVSGIVRKDGGFTSWHTVGGFTKGWTHIASAGGGRLLFYRASDGLGVTGVMGPDGRFASLRTIGGCTTGWTLITPVGGGVLLFYRASDGLAGTGRVNDDGTFTDLQTVGGFLKGWTHIAPAGGMRVLFYRADDGFAMTAQGDVGGGFTNGRVVGGFTTGWTNIASAGGGRLLFYRAGDGTTVTGVVRTDGGFTSIRNVGEPTIGWTHVASA